MNRRPAAPARVPAAPRRRILWPWLSAIPMGFGAWAPIYAGVQARVRSWIGLGVALSSCTVAGWILTATLDPRQGAIAGGFIIIGWVGGIVASILIRPAYRRRLEDPLAGQLQRARARLAERRRAIELAERDPALAVELGIGRPDRPGAADAGVIDLNNAPVVAVSRLSGCSRELAERIVAERARCGGFSSLEDLGMELDLPAAVVEGLRGRVVFLPFGSGSGGGVG